MCAKGLSLKKAPGAISITTDYGVGFYIVATIEVDLHPVMGTRWDNDDYRRILLCSSTVSGLGVGAST